MNRSDRVRSDGDGIWDMKFFLMGLGWDLECDTFFNELTAG